jgi:DNA mismatch repair protein MutS
VAARPRTLFATHFHELTQLRSTYPRLATLKIAIREWEGGIVFLRKIVPGTSDRSFGIHAARIAGLPPLVLRRAEEILQSLELRRDLVARGLGAGEARDQMSLFGTATRPASEDTDSVREALRDFDPDRSTPLQALQLVQDLKKRLT